MAGIMVISLGGCLVQLSCLVWLGGDLSIFATTSLLMIWEELLLALSLALGFQR